MRILNLKDAQKQYGKFSMPGFRSGSMVKKLIACMYYFFVLVLFVMSVVATVKYDFADTRDVILAIVVELLILAIMLTPVVVIGFSDYYDWRGIKLFIIILGSICVLHAVASYCTSLFSDEFINSSKHSVSEPAIVSDGAEGTSDAEIDEEIVKENTED